MKKSQRSLLKKEKWKRIRRKKEKLSKKEEDHTLYTHTNNSSTRAKTKKDRPEQHRERTA